jgi:glycosyltransferase involved in cell wall biosynthesis
VSLNVGKSFLELSQAGVIVGENEAAAAEELRRLMDSPELRVSRGEAGRKYVERHHTIEAVTAQFAESLLAVRRQ